MVSFFLTDIEGSTKLWEQQPARMAAALARHDLLLTEHIQAHHGSVLKARGEGDSFFAVFAEASDAAAAALAVQRALDEEKWPAGCELRVRIALHTGPAELRGDDYYGPTVNRCARLRAIAHGGQVVLSAATATAVGEQFPIDAGLTDLGHHRLRDLTRPEHVYQLHGPGLRSAYPPLRSLASFANNLPQQVTSLVGRESEIERLRTLLEAHRLVTMTGPGGVGKTRLALQLAAEVLERFPDGVWYVELAPLAAGSIVAHQVAATLNVREEGPNSVEDALIDYLADHRALLVLDNCEHLVDDCARLAGRLLSSCASLRLLATSRELLSTAGEAASKVPPLGADDSVRLFVERGRLVRPGWEPSETEMRSAIRLCRRLDGIPLAIELAAARLRVLTVEEIERRLGDRFRLLTEGARTADLRHRTLLAAIEWSYDLLTPPDKVLFDRLSVFAGAFTLDDAESIVSGGGLDRSDILDLLARLVDKSLVVSDPGADSIRYRLLETLREFSAAKLAERGKREDLCRRHAQHFTKIAEQAEPQLIGRDEVTTLAALSGHVDNLRGALGWSAKADPTLGLRLSVALVPFFIARGFISEGREWLQRFMAGPAATPDLGFRALIGVGRLAIRQADYEASRKAYSEALRIAEESGNRDGVARVLNNLGTIAEEQGDYSSAGALYERSLAILREIGTDYQVSVLLNNLGVLHFALGDLARAKATFDEGLSLRIRIGDKRGTASTQSNLAGVLLEQGDFEPARVLYQDSLVLVRELDDQEGEGVALLGLGYTALRTGDLEGARHLMLQSLTVRREVDHKPDIAVALDSLAELALAEGDPERALRLEAAARAVRDANSARLEPIYQSRVEATVEAAKTACGSGRAEAAWRAGLALPLEAILDEALTRDGG